MIVEQAVRPLEVDIACLIRLLRGSVKSTWLFELTYVFGGFRNVERAALSPLMKCRTLRLGRQATQWFQVIVP